MNTASLPVQGAWIEIPSRSPFPLVFGSLPVQGAWIEMPRVMSSLDLMPSLPVQGAWIEMMRRAALDQPHHVAPRAGSVD